MRNEGTTGVVPHPWGEGWGLAVGLRKMIPIQYYELTLNMSIYSIYVTAAIAGTVILIRALGVAVEFPLPLPPW